MATLMIPGVVTFVPLFVLVANVGLINSLPGLILPFLVAPFGVFLMRQFFLGLPRDLLDAGRVDGAGNWASSPGSSCRSQAGPGHARDPDLPRQLEQLPLAARGRPDRGQLHPPRRAGALLGRARTSTNYGLLLAGATVVVLPVLLVFLVFQRRFIEGIATTGIK